MHRCKCKPPCTRYKVDVIFGKSAPFAFLHILEDEKYLAFSSRLSGKLSPSLRCPSLTSHGLVASSCCAVNPNHKGL